MRASVRSLHGGGVLVLLVLLGMSASDGSVLRAQSASVVTLKAAFLYNFARFAEWPDDALAAGAPIVLCVIDEPGVSRALAAATAGRSVNGHELVVTRVDRDGPVRNCHILYAERLDDRSGAALIGRLGGAPVMTVSDFPRFAQLGGVAHLFIEGGRMRFAINVDAASRARIRLSSQLLNLAVIVKDSAHASPR